jgi:signal transduction histidine kinase
MIPETTRDRATPDEERLLAYVADLELEVDRLRRQGQFIEQKAIQTLTQILRLCTGPTPGDGLPTLGEVETTARQLFEVVKDMHDSPGYHPAHDQVVAIAVRPLAQQVFRWQQRLTGVRGAELRLELETDHVEWFPARLRHILDNLLAHALQRRDPKAAGQWVSLGLRAIDANYELRVSDNGAVQPGALAQAIDAFHWSGRHRPGGLGGGVAVVKLLVEQSGGTLAARPRDDRGTDFVLTLPRYDLLDYLE